MRRCSERSMRDAEDLASSPSGSTAARRSSPATSATRSTPTATRPSSSPARPATRGRWRRTSTGPASGTSPASPRPPTGRCRSTSTSAGSPTTGSRPSTGTTATSTTRSRGSASRGVRTVGRFVWEMFGAEDAEPAKRAYDVLYSLTRCEQERYAELGIESPYVRWGLHPELLEAARNAQAAAAASPDAKRRRCGRLSIYFPGALLGPRKPHKEVLEAFTNAQRRQPAADLQGAARAAHELPREGGGGRPADRARHRRHADRRAPAAVRLLRRLPRPEPLGGPRPVPLRGDRVRDAADHQRQPADERGGQRRRQRAAGRRPPGRRPRPRGSRR